jgi:hypothetical protein
MEFIIYRYYRIAPYNNRDLRTFRSGSRVALILQCTCNAIDSEQLGHKLKGEVGYIDYDIVILINNAIKKQEML